MTACDPNHVNRIIIIEKMKNIIFLIGENLKLLKLLKLQKGIINKIRINNNKAMTRPNWFRIDRKIV